MGQIVVAMLAGICSYRGGTAMAKERSANLSDEVTEGRERVRAEEERVDRGGCGIVSPLIIIGIIKNSFKTIIRFHFFTIRTLVVLDPRRE